MNSKPVSPPSWWKHSVGSWNQLINYFNSINLFDKSKLTCQDNWLSISEGQSNTNYQLKTCNNDFFVQIINSNNYPLLPSLETIKTFYQNFSDSKVSPWLVDCHLATDNLRIYSWFEKDISDLTLFDNSCFFKTLLHFLVNLHQISNCEGTSIVTIDINKYLSDYKQQASIISPDKQEEIEILYKSAIQYSSEFKASRLCHNDLSYGNLLWNSKQNLKIIDWEYACFGDPVMDLANLILNCQLNEKQESLLIQSYSQASNNVIDKNKLSNMKQLCQIISKLWLIAQN